MTLVALVPAHLPFELRPQRPYYVVAMHADLGNNTLGILLKDNFHPSNLKISKHFLKIDIKQLGS